MRKQTVKAIHRVKPNVYVTHNKGVLEINYVDSIGMFTRKDWEQSLSEFSKPEIEKILTYLDALANEFYSK